MQTETQDRVSDLGASGALRSAPRRRAALPPLPEEGVKYQEVYLERRGVHAGEDGMKGPVEYGRCEGYVYNDGNFYDDDDEGCWTDRPVGWLFVKRAEYTDSRGSDPKYYTQEVWVTFNVPLRTLYTYARAARPRTPQPRDPWRAQERREMIKRGLVRVPSYYAPAVVDAGLPCKRGCAGFYAPAWVVPLLRAVREVKTKGSWRTAHRAALLRWANAAESPIEIAHAIEAAVQVGHGLTLIKQQAGDVRARRAPRGRKGD